MDFEKEEKWINEMSAKGLHLLKSNGIKYTFEKGTISEYIYRIEYIQNQKSDYLEFLEELNIEYISFVNGYAYLRKRTTEGTFEIYTDNNSKLKHINKIRTPILFIFFFNVFILCALFYTSPQNWGFSVLPILAIILLLILILKLEKKRRTIVNTPLIVMVTLTFYYTLFL